METQTPVKPGYTGFNKPVYILFILLGIYFLFKKDLSQAVIFCALALVFDPFNPQMAFNKRPLYQRLWLFVHLAAVIALFVWMLSGK